MTAFMDFTVPSEAFPLGGVLDADSATRVELARFVPVGEVLVPYFWAETDDDEAVRSEVLASPSVETVAKLDGATGRSLFRVTWAENADGLLDNIRRHDLLVERAVVSDGTWRFKLVAANRETFGEFQAACRADGFDLTVTRLSDSVARDNALYGLTDKQRTALLRAYHAGYYDSKTCVELADVSRGLGISQQALGARLKRGTNALVKNTIAFDGSA